MADKLLGGRYRIQSKIGVGGMANVYRGTDTVLGRNVAIKVMLPQYASDEQFSARFKQEAQAAAALQSPYIVGIFDWGRDGDTCYIIMELLKGTDLKTGLRTHGAIDPRKVAQIGSQICQALWVAHQHDIVHRDIKPQNIMVQPDGNIKVMDFGIARAKNSDLTQDNSVLGTAHYVSPEQTQGKPLGPTSDIYSLGVVMYEAATGEVPFKGDDAISVALKQVKEAPVPPSQINPAVDASLEAIILKCMEKNPTDRFQSAESLRRALLDYLNGKPVVFPKGEGATRLMPSNQANADTTTLMNRPAQKPSDVETTATSMAPISNSDVTGRLQTAEKVSSSSGGSGSSRKKVIIGVCIVLAAIIAIAAGIFAMNGGIPTVQSIPNCSGMSEQAARAYIDATNFFHVGQVTQDYSDSVDEGKVASQDPAAGAMMPKDTSINLVISKGKKPPETVDVPDLSGMTSSQADAALRALKLTPKADSVESDEVDAGKVAKQSPAAGTSVEEGSTVTYYISTGTTSPTVPNVTNYSQASAISAIERAGFVASVDNSLYSDTVVKGNVISYTPQGKQPKGTTISLTISLGPQDSGDPDGINGLFSPAAFLAPSAFVWGRRRR